MNKKPNCFLVGQPRTGTTAFYHEFRQHPDIFVPEQKQLYFFEINAQQFRKNHGFYNSRYYTTYYNFELEQYLSHFKNVNNQKIIVDITPDYLYCKGSAKAIYQFNKNAKIIACFREPLSFLKSLHKHYLQILIEKELDFLKALALEKKRKEGLIIKQNKNIPPWYFFYGERIKYAEQLIRFLNYFPREQIKILFYEEYKKNNNEIFMDVFAFLNVKEQVIPIQQDINKNKEVKNAMLIKISQSKFIRNVVLYLPEEIKKELKNLFKHLTTKSINNEIIDVKNEEKLKIQYYQEVKKFSKLLYEYNFIDEENYLINLWGYNKFD